MDFMSSFGHIYNIVYIHKETLTDILKLPLKSTRIAFCLSVFISFPNQINLAFLEKLLLSLCFSPSSTL